MTSRLKRKLGEIGVDTSSRKANENFCLIGTPLPPLEKSKDTGEFVPLWKQEVRDEKGRRRLHGAFTGGWSAGYFNTVGSQEGWAPATFVSSRNERAKKQATRPEDFMDEEDLQDLKDGLKLVDETEQMDFPGGSRQGEAIEGQDDLEKDPITRTLEASLLPPPKDSVGAKILKKMGWRPGQGIGPRISLKRRKGQDAQAYDPLTGNRITEGSLDIPEDDEEANKHLYATRDTSILLVKRKDNSHGLGYVPGLTLQQSVGDDKNRTSSGPRLAGGFGLGALNDADDDDLDVYDSAQQNHRRRLAYDLGDVDKDETVTIGNSTAKKSSIESPSKSYFRDGLPVLAGFILFDEPVAEDKWFPLPEIPPGWKPNPKSVIGQNLAKGTTSPAKPLNARRGSHLSANQRGTMLGETTPKSIFSYLSEKDKERIQKIASSLASGKAPASATSPSSHIDVPASGSMSQLEPSVAQAALNGFQPFPSDPVKQARYTTYLQSQANTEGSAPTLQPLQGQKPDEFMKEMEDYAKAASLYKPMSGAMAGRFTSAVALDMGPRVVEGLHQPSQAELEASERRKREEEEQKVKADPKVNAAKMGMYGALTRDVRPWVPAKLLCKRFGVKEPDVNLDVPSEPAQKGQPSFTRPEFASSSQTTSPLTTDVSAGQQRSDGPRDITNVGFGEDETQAKEVLTYQRPSMDIFKAIFASDDEDEGESSEAEEKVVDVDEDQTAQGKGFTKATIIFDDQQVDPDTFKPTFIPRDSKAKKSKEDKHKDKKDKKEKKKRDKDKKGVLVSFEMDDDGRPGGVEERKQSKDRPSKKRRKGGVDEGSGIVGDQAAMEVDNPSNVGRVGVPALSLQDTDGPNKGRRRAVDFMD